MDGVHVQEVHPDFWYVEVLHAGDILWTVKCRVAIGDDSLVRRRQDFLNGSCTLQGNNT